MIAYVQTDCINSDINSIIYNKDYDKLSKAFTNQIYKFAHRYNFTVSFEDLVQTGHTALLDAAERFKPEMGTKFTPFALKYIRGSMLTQLRKEKRTSPFKINNEQFEKNNMELDADDSEESNVYLDLAGILNEHLILCRDLTVMECSVMFDYYLEFNCSATKTAKKYNVSKQCVADIITRSLKKIKKKEFSNE